MSYFFDTYSKKFVEDMLTIKPYDNEHTEYIKDHVRGMVEKVFTYEPRLDDAPFDATEYTLVERSESGSKQMHYIRKTFKRVPYSIYNLLVTVWEMKNDSY